MGFWTLKPSYLGTWTLRVALHYIMLRLIVLTWRPRGLSKWVISRVISTLNGVTLSLTLLITDLPSPLGLQVNP